MASFAAFLEVGAKKYPLFRYELSMHQETDTLGRPASPVLGGTIVCTLSSPGQQDPFLYQWMLSPVMQHDGLIRLTDPTSGATLKTISFFNAYCTQMDLTFMPGQQGGGGSSLIQLQISPQRVAVGAITHDNNWPVASHGSGQSFVRQELQPQPKPKPKPGIVVGSPPVGLPRMPRIPPTTPPGTPPRVPPKLPQIPRNVPKIPLPHLVLVFLAALLSWHDAGVADEWEQKLPEKDEQRYRELEAKRSKEIAKGGKLSPQEEEEYQALYKRKYPSGQGGLSDKSLPSGGESRQDLIDELRTKGIKFDEDKIVRIARDKDGKIVFLEEGVTSTEAAKRGLKGSSGLAHIVEEHGDDFARKGIPEEQIPDFIIGAVKEGKIVKYQGKGTGRPVYEYSYGGRTYHVAITIGRNGYIVGANPVSF